jgi:transposase
MNQIQATLKSENSTVEQSLYMALELSETKWKLAFSDGSSGLRHQVISAGATLELHDAIEAVKRRFGLPSNSPVLSCYEAGRDGFWLHRYLDSCGIANVVVDSASIEVSRRKRRAKTDRLDAGSLVRMLMRYCAGERRLWSVVRMPSVEQEDARHLHRELESLRDERTMHRNRMRSLLKLHGIKLGNPSRKDFATYIETIRLWDGTMVPGELRARLIREHERLRCVEEQIRTVEKEQRERIRRADTDSDRRVAQLMSLCGIGITSAWVFEKEFFGWRNFNNRREVGGCAGLTPTPYNSGKSRREQGISKAGNERIRKLIVEIGWCWLRYQPNSELSRWFNERFANGGKRMRRIGIVALARKLLIALWRFRTHGLIPEGARLKAIA